MSKKQKTPGVPPKRKSKARSYIPGDGPRAEAALDYLRDAYSLLLRIGESRAARSVKRAITATQTVQYRLSVLAKDAEDTAGFVLPPTPEQALQEIAEIIYPVGQDDVERDCIELFDRISGVVQDAGLGPKPGESGICAGCGSKQTRLMPSVAGAPAAIQCRKCKAVTQRVDG